MLAAMIPWAHSKINNCKVETKGVIGTKCLCFFSSHTLDSNRTKKPRQLPHDHPFGRRPHFDDADFQEKTKGGVWVFLLSKASADGTTSSWTNRWQLFPTSMQKNGSLRGQ
jgi:hypothetical protein